MAGPSYTHKQLEQLWVLAGGLQQYADTAAAIAEAESKGCQYAKAGPYDDRPRKLCSYRQTTTENSYGLWQINRMAHPNYTASQLWTVLGNAQAAVAISKDGSNFNPWTTYTNGSYRTYLVAGSSGGGGSTSPPVGRTESAVAPHGHSGWRVLRHELATTMPTNLRRSRRIRQQALNTLKRAAKVG